MDRICVLLIIILYVNYLLEHLSEVTECFPDTPKPHLFMGFIGRISMALEHTLIESLIILEISSSGGKSIPTGRLHIPLVRSYPFLLRTLKSFTYTSVGTLICYCEMLFWSITCYYDKNT